MPRKPIKDLKTRHLESLNIDSSLILVDYLIYFTLKYITICLRKFNPYTIVIANVFEVIMPSSLSFPVYGTFSYKSKENNKIKTQLFYLILYYVLIVVCAFINFYYRYYSTINILDKMFPYTF